MTAFVSQSFHLFLWTADAVFLILYKELYYRHIYAKVSVSTSQSKHITFTHRLLQNMQNVLKKKSFFFRVDQLWIRDLSHTTITATFSTTFLVSAMVILCVLLARYYQHTNYPSLCLCTDADGPAPLELPNQWLWDIIDEFIYQVECCVPYAPFRDSHKCCWRWFFFYSSSLSASTAVKQPKRLRRRLSSWETTQRSGMSTVS